MDLGGLLETLERPRSRYVLAALALALCSAALLLDYGLPPLVYGAAAAGSLLLSRRPGSGRLWLCALLVYMSAGTLITGPLLLAVPEIVGLLLAASRLAGPALRGRGR